MSALHHVRRVDEVLGGSRTLARVTSVVGAGNAGAIPAANEPAINKFMRDVNEARLRDVPDGVGTVAGAVAGYYFCRKDHPYLGVIGGASLGRNVPALFDPVSRGMALRNLITTAGGVMLSVNTPKHPALGFVGGALLGGLASYFAGIR